MKRRKRQISDGARHGRIAVGVLITAIPIGIFLAVLYNVSLGVGVILGVICGYFIDPDLDQRSTTHTENRIYRINKVWGALHHIYWIPYSLLPHRCSLTHGGRLPLGWLTMAIATMIRMTYALWWVIVVLVVCDNQGWHTAIPLRFLIGLFAGWYVQDLGHWCKDFLFKKKRRK